MTFLKALNQIHTHSVFSFAGGGGKSTLIYLLARELSTFGYRVLVTTTTMIYHPDVKKRPYDNLYIKHPDVLIDLADHGVCGGITVAALEELNNAGERKLKGYTPEDIDKLFASRLYDFILVEADGARHLPIKAPGEKEPVIPLSTSITFGIIGLDALNGTVSPDTVFRNSEFSLLTGVQDGELITEEVILKLVQSQKGLFKNSPPKSEKIVILNKADNDSEKEKGIELAQFILSGTSVPDRIFITAAETKFKQDPVQSVEEHLKG